MDAVDLWMLILAAVAAIGSLVSIGFLVAGVLQRRVERPIVDLHLSVGLADVVYEEVAQREGRRVFELKVRSVGDATPRHLQVEGTFRIEHHHDEEGLAALPPGSVLRLPISIPVDQRTIDGRVQFVAGAGRQLRVDERAFKIVSDPQPE